LAAEVQRLRQENGILAQTQTRLRDQVRVQEADLTVLHAQVKALQDRLAAPSAA
jgi:hypothetical protein